MKRMKGLCKTLAAALAAGAAATAAAQGAAGYVQHVEGDVSDSRQNFPLRVARGETVDLSIDFLDRGAPLDISGAAVTLHTRTNGMDAAESWQVPGTATNNSALFVLDVDAVLPLASGQWSCVASRDGRTLARLGGPAYVRGTAAGTVAADPVSALEGYMRQEPSISIPDADAARGITFEDSHGCGHNGAVEIGAGARAEVSQEAISAAPSNTVVRSVSVAVGPGADATDPSNPVKSQAIAVGNQSRASAVNSIAIGSGVRHADEDDMSGGNAYAAAPQAVSVGYSAKAVAAGAVQIGPGVNDTPNSLQFMGVPVVRNGKVVTDGLDTNAVRRMIQDESDRGIMYGSIGATNGYHYLHLSGYNAAQDSDPEFVLAVSADTNSEYAASFPLYPGSPNRRDIYSAQTVDRIVDGATSDLAAAVGAMMARIAAWGSPYESPLLSSLGPAGSEGPTVYTRGGENELSVSFWMRYQPHAASTNQAAGLVPGYWSAFCIPQLSMAPARATREGGAALEAFLDVADVPLGASGAWSTNCIPQDAATQEVGGHGDRFVVCANVVADTGVRLSLGGGEPVWFPASNGVRQVRNVLVAPGDPSVSVLADDPGGSVSLALAVNPWVEFRSLVGNVPEYRYGDGGRGMDGPVQVTNSFVHVVGRLRLSPGGGLDALYTLRNLAGGAMSATGAVSTAFSSGSFPADVRLRHVWGALAGGFGGGVSGDPEAVVQRFATRSAPVWWTDAEVDDLYLRGLRELRARGLDRPLPDRGAQ